VIDALTSVAFSVHGSKGVFALLLGSGLSTAAGIPTGWDITLDLIRKSAAAGAEDCGPDASAWYKTKTGQDADYSMILDSLAKSPADRMNLLRSYFEPTAEELEKGLKAPTAAHKSIARLVSKGYVRVIVTTNFDRLLERALESEGISPTVISTPDASLGALPLAHAHCTVIKLHGDYRDTRIKNTARELETYAPEMDRLLDKVLDEYGLIVCGWSASWDKALCRAVLRCANRRFNTYWARRGNLSEEARALISHRQATELEIESADAFFASLETKVEAIERYSEPHPASAKLAIVSLKRFITEEKRRVELRDLVATETERSYNALASLSLWDPSLTAEKLLERMKYYENTCEILIALLAHGAFWGRAEHQRLWKDSISRIAGAGGVRHAGGAQTHLLTLQIYPACLLFYSSCLGAIAADNYEAVTRICRDTVVKQDGNRRPLILSVLPWSVLDIEVSRKLPGYERRWTPVNDRLFEVLREPLREYLPDDAEYEDAFDECEYLTALVHLDFRIQLEKQVWAPVGRFGWRRELQNKPIYERLAEEAKKNGENWDIIQSGLFPSLATFKEIEELYRNEILSNARRQWY
jgi:SIR2-like protein